MSNLSEKILYLHTPIAVSALVQKDRAGSFISRVVVARPALGILVCGSSAKHKRFNKDNFQAKMNMQITHFWPIEVINPQIKKSFDRNCLI